MGEKTKICVLVSSVTLPSVKIGSWSNRVTILLRNSNYFDLVLSPTHSPNELYKFCDKRKSLPILGKFRKWHLKNWVGRDYLTHLNALESKAKEIELVVMDDLMLVELMVDFKRSALVKVTVTFSFHGHRLILPPAFGADVDKVLFLTKMGYYESLRLNEVFTPEVHIVGNGVNSSQFFPVSKDQKHILRRNLGFVETDEIIVWMANERPKKGLHLFLKIAHKLLQLYPTIQFVVLGNKKPLTIQSNRIKAFGQVSNVELPKYLQAADYYFFTTLWKEGFGLSMVEAAKCGCTIIASDNGGVSEVNQELPQSYLVKAPNMVEEWLQVFKEARMGRSNYNSEEKRGELEKFQSYELWERKYLAALEY